MTKLRVLVLCFPYFTDNSSNNYKEIISRGSSRFIIKTLRAQTWICEARQLHRHNDSLVNYGQKKVS